MQAVDFKQFPARDIFDASIFRRQNIPYAFLALASTYWQPSEARDVYKRQIMARVCQVTGKGPMAGNNVSHANNRTKRRFLPNLQYRRFWIESENRWLRLRVSNAGLRTIDKNGIDAVLADLRARGEI